MAVINGTPDDDSIVGTSDPDIISGLGGNDTILGRDGGDAISGGDGDDYLRGEQGNDFLYGNDGKDYLGGGPGDDTLDGGAGEDRVSYAVDATNGVTVDLNLQGVAQDTGMGWDTLISIEHLSGTIYDDTLIGDGADNWLWGGSDGSGVTGNDTISGGGGNDLIEVGAGNHTLDGGSGVDILSLFGNATDIGPTGVTVDLRLQGSVQDTGQGMMLLTGFEQVSGSIYDDTIIGDDGWNNLNGDLGSDVLIGGGGNDTLFGDGRVNVDTGVTGTSGHITTYESVPDPDYVGGDDWLEGGLGDDFLAGGRGIDTASYEHASGSVEVVLADAGFGYSDGADGNDTLSNDIENIRGSAYDDNLLGNESDNVIDGGDGNDAIYGFGGNDTLLGGDGNDFVRPYSGNDNADGGDGIDRISFYDPGQATGIIFDLNLQGTAQDTGHGIVTAVNFEQVSGTAYDDTIIGDGGDNWLWGGSDGAGNDGNDTISGNGGNDLIEVGSGNHTLDGGAGADTLSVWGNDTDTHGAMTVNLKLQGAAQDTGQGMMTLSGFENVSGSTYGDTLIGGDGANILAGDRGDDAISGGKGDDALYGDGRVSIDINSINAGAITLYGDVREIDPTLTDGNDTLDGGKGDDALYGGGGNDVMSGGQGRDTFVIEDNSGNDVVTDFSKSQDLINFDVAGVSGFGDLTLTASGAHDTLITWGTGDSLLLEGVKPNQVSASNFSFGAAASPLAFEAADSAGGLGFANHAHSGHDWIF
jgi:Ca2+-binding RTX toxin-like protein